MELPKTPSLRLDGKTALVTGASSGIGLACAVALAEAGAKVTAAARSEDKLDTLVEAAQEKGLKMQAYALDVSDLDAVSGMLDKSNSFDILVNSAGMARHGPKKISYTICWGIWGGSRRTQDFFRKCTSHHLAILINV